MRLRRLLSRGCERLSASRHTLNLRNTIAHGLHRSVGAIDASLLIQASLLLASVSLRPVEVPPQPPEGAGPAG